MKLHVKDRCKKQRGIISLIIYYLSKKLQVFSIFEISRSYYCIPDRTRCGRYWNLLCFYAIFVCSHKLAFGRQMKQSPRNYVVHIKHSARIITKIYSTKSKMFQRNMHRTKTIYNQSSLRGMRPMKKQDNKIKQKSGLNIFKRMVCETETAARQRDEYY